MMADPTKITCSRIIHSSQKLFLLSADVMYTWLQTFGLMESIFYQAIVTFKIMFILLKDIFYLKNKDHHSKQICLSHICSNTATVT